MKRRVLAAFLLALSLGAPPATWAQDSGSLTVSITDNYGVLPGAVVRLFGKDGQAPQRAVADATGNARFSSLAAGEYTLRASLNGFADAVKAVTWERPSRRSNLSCPSPVFRPRSPSPPPTAARNS